MSRTIAIDGLTLRLRTIRPYHRCRTLTYVEILHKGIWLECGDPHHGEMSSAAARAALVHYARMAIRKADTADNGPVLPRT